MAGKVIKFILTILLLASHNTVVEENSGEVIVEKTNASVVAEFNSVNWGLVDNSSDYWKGDYYTLYSDGTCEYYKEYNLSGKKDETKFTIPEEEFNSIVTELENNYSQTHYNAMDGVGWRFIIHGVDGSSDKKSSGYIYDTELENVVEKINSYKK